MYLKYPSLAWQNKFRMQSVTLINDSRSIEISTTSAVSINAERNKRL